jgi:hypothetical protein
MVITYLAIRLTTGDYYWGSTSQTLIERERRHRNSSKNFLFTRYLKKYPNEWVFVEVWKTDNRDKEQQMLDFHFGRPGCLNTSTSSTGGIIPGNGFKSGDDNIAKLPEIRKKISEKTKGKPHNVKIEYRTPWYNAMANKQLWRSAQEHYEKWLSLHRPGSARYANIIGTERTIIRKMIEKFQSGWIPNEDILWLDYFNL